MKLYVTRHGQTEWNYENKVCGTSDIQLSANGIEQAKELALKLTAYKIDIIISSPMKRARETAEIISETTGVNCIIDERLLEQNYGIFEGAQRDNADFLAAKKKLVCRYPEGESMVQVAHRVFNLIDELKEKSPAQNVLLVSHGGVCRVIETYFNDLSNEEFYAYRLRNCEIKEYDI
ncbi:MAG: histidine phosphatase family protein [Clostridia bacterium]|nr:histidine phosphatase family protein [Clostridia bacterium]